MCPEWLQKNKAGCENGTGSLIHHSEQAAKQLYTGYRTSLPRHQVASAYVKDNDRKCCVILRGTGTSETTF